MMSIHDQGKFIEGMNRGMAEGIAIGKANSLRSVAIQMNNEGLPLDMIARIAQENPKVIQSWINEEAKV